MSEVDLRIREEGRELGDGRRKREGKRKGEVYEIEGEEGVSRGD